MEVKEETRSLHPHKMDNQEKFLQKEPVSPLTQKSYLHGKKKTQYILLVYQLYNLVGHRLRLLYKLDKLVMVTSRTHAIAKNTYLGPRPVRFDKTKGLSYTIPRSFGQVLGKLLRNSLQTINQTAIRLLGGTYRLDHSLSCHSKLLQLLLVLFSTIYSHNKKDVSTSTTEKKSLRTQIKRLPRFFWITSFSILTLCSSAALSFFKAAFSASSRVIFWRSASVAFSF